MVEWGALSTVSDWVRYGLVNEGGCLVLELLSLSLWTGKVINNCESVLDILRSWNLLLPSTTKEKVKNESLTNALRLLFSGESRKWSCSSLVMGEMRRPLDGWLTEWVNGLPPNNVGWWVSDLLVGEELKLIYQIICFASQIKQWILSIPLLSWKQTWVYSTQK